MFTVTVLTPKGRRQQVKVTPNTTILQILEDVCLKHGFKAEEYDLRHHNKILDVTAMFRFTSLPNNAQLEMVETVKPRRESPVTVGLQFENGERLTGVFSPSDSIWNVIVSLSPGEENSANLVVIYMRQEIYGVENLKMTTLRSLGLTSGRAVFRVIYMSPEELRSQANVSAILPPRSVVKEPSQAKIPKGPSEAKIPKEPSEAKIAKGPSEAKIPKEPPKPPEVPKKESPKAEGAQSSKKKGSDSSKSEGKHRGNFFESIFRDDKSKKALLDSKKSSVSSSTSAGGESRMSEHILTKKLDDSKLKIENLSKKTLLEEEEINVEEKRGIIEEKRAIIEEKRAIIEEKRGIIEEKRGIIEEKRGIIEEKRGTIEEKRGTVEEKRGIIEEKRGIIEEKRGTVEEKRGTIEEKRGTIEEKHGSVEIRMEEKHGSMEVHVEEKREAVEIHERESKAFVLGDRNAVAFNLNSIKPVAFEEEPDDFYELTVHDAQLLLKQAKQLCADLEDAPLMTSAQREFEKDKRVLSLLHQYKKTVLRVKFPDRTVLQGTFSSLEPVSAVEKFVSDYLESPKLPFYLYTTPPKVILKPDTRLIECGCVPCCVLYFGLPPEASPPSQYLKTEVLEMLSTPSAAAIQAYESRGLEKKPTKVHEAKEASEEAEKRKWSRKVSNAEAGPSGSQDWGSGPREQESSSQFKVPKWFRTNK